MFSELTDDRNRFSDYESLADTLFDPSSNASDMYLESTFPPNSIDFKDYEKLMDLNDDILLPQYIEFDIEKQPQLLNLVSPNDILPTSAICLSIGDQFFNDVSARDKMLETIFPNETEDITGVTDVLNINEILEQISKENSNLFDDIPAIEVAKNNHPSLDNILAEVVETAKVSPKLEVIDEDILPPFDQSNGCDSFTMSPKTYHPDYDHCYSCYSKLYEDGYSSGSSSEVDVVTVTEEPKTPYVPKVEAPPLRKTPKKGQKSPKKRKNQNSLSPKTFNAAMKRNMTRITTIRRTYRRKINNSVETTPSNSLPSSAHSSRCSSDVEDAGKRANHNSSERKRREVLRTALQNLRLCVPGVQNNLKAPKVQILNCAKEFIREACQKDQEYRIMKKSLKSKKKILQMKLKSLRAEMGLS